MLIKTVDIGVDLMFSEEDEINYNQGYYFQDREEDTVSQGFETEDNAMDAFNFDGILWEL